MAKIERKTFKPFAHNANLDQLAQIGSLRAGAPMFSKDPDVLQGLSNYKDGWFSIAMGENSPAIEDMNAIQFVFSYFIAQILQDGVCEWDVESEYAKNSIAKSGTRLYISKVDGNIGNPISSSAHWAAFGGPVALVEDDYEAEGDESIIVVQKPITIGVDDPANIVLNSEDFSEGQVVTVINKSFALVLPSYNAQATVTLPATANIITLNRNGEISFVKTSSGLIPFNENNPRLIYEAPLTGGNFTSGENSLGVMLVKGTGNRFKFGIKSVAWENSLQVGSTTSPMPVEGSINIYRNSILLRKYKVSVYGGMDIPFTGFDFIDTPSIGDNTYEVRAEVGTANTRIIVTDATLFAEEIRGGIVLA